MRKFICGGKMPENPELIQIKASAGSGKTYTLTHNYLQRLLACGGNVSGRTRACDISALSLACAASEILAVTFTNAAASEMRSRVIGRLKRAALSKMEDNDPIPPQMAEKWLEALLHDMGALNIRTIDSLLHLIVRSAALDLDLNPDFEPEFETEKALEPLLDYFLQKCIEDENRWKLLKKAFFAIYENSGAKGFSAGDKLHSRLLPIFDDVLLGAFDNLEPEQNVEAEHKRLRADLQAAAQNLLNEADAENLPLNGTHKKVLLRYSSDDFPGPLPACATKENGIDICNKGARPSTNFEAAYADFAEKARNWHQKGEILRRALLYYPMFELAKNMFQTFRDERREDFKVPNSQIARLAGAALASENGVSESLCRLGSRLTHFLIDEFQDTSRDQWDVMRQLVLEALSRGGSLTWVGDVKQSIYGFRKGDPSLFNEVYKDRELRAIAPGNIPPINLETNYRSRKVVVEHTNQLFGCLADPGNAMEAIAELLDKECPAKTIRSAGEALAEVYRDVAQKVRENGAGGYVACECVDGETAGEIDENIISRVVELAREEIGARRPPSDILALTRSNRQAAQLAEALLAENIPVITENSLLLKEHPLIRQMAAFLEFLENPDNALAFWTVIAGNIFLEHPLAAGLDFQELHNWRAAGGEDCDFAAFASLHPQIWANTLGPFISQAALRAPYDAMMEWSARMDIEKRFPADKTCLRRFLEVLQRAENNGAGSLASFLDYWHKYGDQEKTPMPENMDAVRIMTIHKAKGLQAPVVILPWTSFSMGNSGKPEPLEVDGMRLAVPLSAKTGGGAWRAAQAREAAELFNMLYVAITRPEEELYILQPSSRRRGKKSLDAALEIMFEKSGLTPPYELGEQPPAKAGRPTLAQLLAEKIEPRPKAAIPPPDNGEEPWKPMQWMPRLKIFRATPYTGQMTANERGTFMHFCMQNLTITGNPSADARRAFNFALDNSTISVPDNKEIRDAILSALEWFAALKPAKKWLEKGIPEQSLTDGKGNIFRADFLVPLGEDVLVLEYKSGQPDEKHEQQALNYLECVEKSGGYRGNLTALLVYLDLRQFRLVRPGLRFQLVSECPLQAE